MIALAPNPRRARLVELAGPAGVGKTTLSQALGRRYSAAPGSIWGLPVLPLLGNGVQLVPTFLGLWLHSRSLLWDETRHMVRLRTLDRELERGYSDRGILLFDEGPVFALAWLRGFGHPSMRAEISAGWWRATLEQWAKAVDAVIVLDAPDTLLAHRVRTRPIWHEVQAASDQEISAWMQRFRAALEWVLAGLTANGGPAVVRISTEQDDPERIAQQVLSALHQVSDGN
jgi:hypothetical protein